MFIMCKGTKFIFTISLLILIFSEFTLSGYIPPGPKYKCPTSNQIWPCQCHKASDEGVNIKCDEISLATAAPAIKHLVHNQIAVESLHLYNLNADQIYGNLFEGLNISKIIIENSPVDSIASDFFYPIRGHLKELVLKNTKLRTFPEGLGHLSNLESLTIDSHEIEHLKESINGLDSLKNLQISNGSLTEISKETFTNFATLLRLDLHGNKLKGIPKDGFKNLRSVEFLDLSFNEYSKLDPSYFAPLTKLTWVNASHNPITEFSRGAFARNSFLRVIHLTHCKIKNLNAAAFRGMRFLRRLYLSDNQISDVGRAAFGSISRVGTIDLARNQLKIIDYQMFNQLPLVEVLDISENHITTIKTGAFRDLTYVVINISRNSIETIEKEAFVNCINMTVLDMSFNKIKNFTKGSFDEFSYPNEWRLEHNALESAGDIPLKSMTGIKILNASYNSIRIIPKGTFPKLYELHTVDFSHNNINEIFSSIFVNLFSLRYLDLCYNNLTELKASIFGAIPTLIDLKLEYNNLNRVSGATFSRLASLRELSINNNNLSSVFQIPPGMNHLKISFNKITNLRRAWPTMNSLLSLDLSGNNLGQHLEKGSFQSLASLQKLNLSNNNIEEVPLEALSDLTTIQYLDLSHNSISNLTKSAFGRLPVVFELLLGFNKITQLAEKTFDGLLQLLHLDLHDNKIEQIPIGAFAGLVSLQKLNLSSNYLKKSDNGSHCIFEENLSLRTLDLSNNKFTYINALTFPENRWIPYRLSEIDLSYNMLVKISKDILQGTKKVTKLNLSYNKIRDISPNVFINLTAIQELDLSGNVISYLDENLIGPPPNLTELILKRNYLRKFPTEILSKAPLKKIDLTGNKLIHFEIDFLPKIKNGSLIIFDKNPLKCDCRLIPLKRFISEYRHILTNNSQEYSDNFKNFKCEDGKYLNKIEEKGLICDYIEDPLSPKIISYSDLEIRNLVQKGAELNVFWRVKSKRDVNGFRLTILDSREYELSTETVSYSVRSAQINLDPSASFICLAPIYSKREINFLPTKLCQKLNTDAISQGINHLKQGLTYTIIILISFIYFSFNNI